MKKTVLWIAVLAMFSYGGMFSYGEDGHDHKGHDHAKATEHQEPAITVPDVAEKLVKVMNVGNTLCPVTGNNVKEMGGPVSYEYNGKLYNLCCEGCSKDFKKDPEKCAKIAEKQVSEIGVKS